MKNIVGVIILLTAILLTACSSSPDENVPSKMVSSKVNSSAPTSSVVSTNETSKPVSSEMPSSDIEGSNSNSSAPPTIHKPASSLRPSENNNEGVSNYQSSSQPEPDSVSTSKVQIIVTNGDGIALEGVGCKLTFMPPLLGDGDPMSYEGSTNAEGSWLFSMYYCDRNRIIAGVTMKWDRNFKATTTSIDGVKVEGIANGKDNEFHTRVIDIYEQLVQPIPNETVVINITVEEITE